MSTLNARSKAVEAAKNFIRGNSTESLLEIAKHSLSLESPDFVFDYTQLDHTNERTLQNSKAAANSKLLYTFLSYVDFPAVFQDVATSLLIDRWKNETGTWRKWVGNLPLSNFTATNLTGACVLPEPNMVKAGTEYKHINLYGEISQAQLNTYGDIFNIGRESFHNGGSEAFLKIVASISSCFDRMISTKVYGLLNANPAYFEGKELFHADHQNITFKTGDYEKDLEKALALIFQQKIAIDGTEQHLSIKPKFVLTGPEEALPLTRALVDFNAAMADEDKIQVVIEPRLSGHNAWYLAGDKDVSSIRTFTLDGATKPTIMTKEYNQRNGMDVKYRFDFDVQPVDYRSLVRVKQA